jgi:hypothetical protein
MTLRRIALTSALATALVVSSGSAAGAQAGAETYTATGSVKGGGGASASAPMTIVIERRMPPKEVERFTSAFKTGGIAALRKALAGVPPVGSVKIGARAAVPLRLSMERQSDKGRLVTLVSDSPILLLGGGLPDAKPKEGYDLGIVDLEIHDGGTTTGVLTPAAKVTVNPQGVFVVSDYSSELILLSNVKKAK